jgi:hypothetical protein
MKTQAKPTDGPWKWEPSKHNIVEGMLVSEAGDIVLMPYLTPSADEHDVGVLICGFDFTNYADKPLIAAAPALLLALKTCRKQNADILDNCIFPAYGLKANSTPHEQAWRKKIHAWNVVIDAAIAKAQGTDANGPESGLKADGR